jgi:cGMP-dependent protein kinase
MGAACIKRKNKLDSTSGPTLANTHSSATFLTTGPTGAFETTLFPWQSRKLTKKKLPLLYPDQIDNITGVERSKTAAEATVLKDALRNNAVLGELSPDLHEKLLSSMKAYDLSALEVVYEVGSYPASCFVVTSGLLEAVVNGERLQEYHVGDCFGARALLYDQQHSKTIRTLQISTLWGVERSVFKLVLAQHNASVHLENLSFLRSIKMLDRLTNEQVELLAEQLSSLTFACGTNIVIEGEAGSVLYIIKQGSVTCSAKGRDIRQLHRGDYFGEQALLYDTPRTATVTAATDTKLLAISRDSLHKALGDTLSQVIYKNCIRIAFSRHPSLSNLLQSQREVLLDLMDIIKINSGAQVETAKALAVVLQGSLRLPDNSLLEQLDMLEDINAIAETDCTLAVMLKAGVERALGGRLEAVAAESEAVLFLRNVPLCRGFSVDQLKALWAVLRLERFEAGATIVKKGEEGKVAYLVKSGAVQIIKDGEVLRTIERYGLFGERALMEQIVRTASVIAREPTECCALHREDFERVLDEGVLKYLASRMQLQNDAIALTDLDALCLLGSGAYANVFLVKHSSLQSIYALKTVPRKLVRANLLAANLQLERELLLQLEHPFIMKLVKTFKDRTRLYFLTEFVQGEELFDVLSRVKSLPPAHCRFYVACLLLVLEYLHERDIVYRDIKPENVMIDEDGYPKVIDFGFAKRIEGKTYSNVGTPHYLAPEVIQGLGYGCAVDYWSLGILCYELVFGNQPFGAEESSPQRIYESIVKGKLVFPEELPKTHPIRSFLETLLARNPNYRRTQASKFRSHPWLLDMDWVLST